MTTATEGPPIPTRTEVFHAVRQLVTERRVTGRAGEWSTEYARRTDRNPRGFWIPHETRVMTTTSGVGGIPTLIPDGKFVDALRARLVLAALGCTITDLSDGKPGLVSIPRITVASVPTMVDEGVAPAETNPVIGDSVKFTPHTATSCLDVTRRMLSEATPNFENFLFNELAKGVAVAVDQQALNGGGTGPATLGLLQNPAVTVLPLGTNGAAITRRNCVELERIVGNKNGDAGQGASVGWLTSPNGRSYLRDTDNATASGRYAWDTDNRILGAPAFATTNVPANIQKNAGSNLTALVYADWAAAVVVQLFGAVDLTFNPYTQSASGTIRLQAFQDFDAQLYHPEAVAAVFDMAAPS